MCMYVCKGTVQRIHGPQDEIKRIRKSVEMNTMDNIEYPACVWLKQFSMLVLENKKVMKISALSI